MIDEDIKKYIDELTGGDILTYKPILKSSKVINTSYVEDGKTIYTDAQDIPIEEYSKSLNALSNALPSDVTTALNKSVSTIEAYINLLDQTISESKFNDTSFDDYKAALGNNNTDIVEDYIDYHSNNINGNTAVEVYHNLYQLKKEATSFKALFNTITYGNSDISPSKAKSIDDTLVQRLHELEHTEKFNKINYMALNSDVQLNKISGTYADTLRKCASKLYSLTSNEDIDQITDNKGCVSNTVQKAFDNAVIKGKQDTIKATLATNTSLVETSMLRLVNSRNTLIDAIHTKSTLKNLTDTHGHLSTVIKTVSDAEDKAISSMVDFNKSMLLTALNKDDTINSLSEKSNLRNIFHHIS